jgi:hypothetical protein
LFNVSATGDIQPFIQVSVAITDAMGNRNLGNTQPTISRFFPESSIRDTSKTLILWTAPDVIIPPVRERKKALQKGRLFCERGEARTLNKWLKRPLLYH